MGGTETDPEAFFIFKNQQIDTVRHKVHFHSSNPFFLLYSNEMHRAEDIREGSLGGGSAQATAEARPNPTPS